MRAPGPWPQNPATIGNSTYTLQIVRRGRVTGHYHIYERRRPRSAISPLFVEPYTLFTAAAISYPATSHHWLPCTARDTWVNQLALSPLSSFLRISLLGGAKSRFYFIRNILHISLSFLYKRFIVAYCNASVGGVGAVFWVHVLRATHRRLQYSVILWHTPKYKIYYEEQRTD